MITPELLETVSRLHARMESMMRVLPSYDESAKSPVEVPRCRFRPIAGAQPF